MSHAASFAFARKPPAFHLVMQIDPSSQVASGLKEVRMQYHSCQQMGWAGWKLCPCGKLRNPDQFPFIHVSGRIKPFAETLSELNFLNCSPILLRNAITLWWQKVKRKSQIICHYKWHPDKQQKQVFDWGKTEEQLRFDSIITSSKLPLLWASAINLLRHHA